jgi:hypothetical protein
MRGSLAGGSRVSRQPYIAQHGARPSVALGRASLLNLCPPAGPVRGRRGVGVRGCAHLYVYREQAGGRPRGIGLDLRLPPSGVICVAPASRSRHRTICRLTRAAVNVTHLHSSQPPGAANAFTSTRRTPRARRARPHRTSAAARGPRAGGRRGARDGPLSTLTTLTTCQSAARRLVVHTWWFTGIAAKACIGHGSPRSCRNRQEERRIHSPHAPSCQDELGEVDRYVSRTYLGGLAPPPRWRRRGRHRGRCRGRHRGEALSRGGRRPRPHQGR